MACLKSLWPSQLSILLSMDYGSDRLPCSACSSSVTSELVKIVGVVLQHVY